MRKKFKNKDILFVAIIISVISPLIVYCIILFIKSRIGVISNIPPIGSSDGWIGFAGSIIGGLITMLALFFTIRYEIDVTEKNTALSMRPCIIGELTCYDEIEKNYIFPIA